MGGTSRPHSGRDIFDLPHTPTHVERGRSTDVPFRFARAGPFHRFLFLVEREMGKNGVAVSRDGKICPLLPKP